MDQVVPDESNINPLALVFLVAMGLVMFRGGRSAAIRALLAIAAFLPLGQQVVVFGLHFQFFRILILIGLFRVLTRGEAKGFEFTKMDKLFMWWALAGMVCAAIRDPSGIMGINCLGGAFNAFGTFFLMRLLIRDMDEVVAHVRLLAVVAVLVALAMSYEVFTHKNLFYVFGGVPQEVLVRDGRFRCQGPFRHPILAGTFAATLFPLLIGLWFQPGRDKKLALVGLAGCAFSTVVAASSGAILTCLTAMIGFGLWMMRFRMSLIRRGIVAFIVVLALVMDAPVYYIIAKLSDMLGGTGWHRSYLIDQFLSHFTEWCFIGSSVTAHWAPSGQVLAVDPNNMDITNHYIEQGLQGGLLRLGLFIAMIVFCFKVVGQSLRSEEDERSPEARMLWALGVSLACHCTAFISISYFDQIEVFWFWLMAVFAAIPVWAAQRAAALESPPPADDYEGQCAAEPTLST